MATVVTMLDTVTAWVQANICDKIKLKKPPLDEVDATDEGYAYELITPHAFAFFVPTQDKIALPAVAPMPSVCVRITDGAADFAAGRNDITFELCFSTWSTGTHGKDIFIPIDRNTFRQMSDKDAARYFEKNGDGWRDAWNMIDIALRELGNATHIDGIEIDKSVPVKYAPLKEQEAIPDYYPFWFATLSFAVKIPILPNMADTRQFL